MSARSDTVGAAPVMTSRDIVAGLGAAPRELLAACLALFDDSTLQRRIGTLVDRWSSTEGKDGAGSTDAEAAAAVRSSLQEWQASPLSDDTLRVLLWMYLREAFALPPVTFASSRSAATVADDIVARALHSLQPGRMARYAQERGLKDAKVMPATLDALARKTMEEMMASFFNADDAQSVQARERLLSETRARLGQLPPEDQGRLMQAAGVDGLNDAALRKILLTGGGLGALGASVSLAGFSAYILAAQASAFIPLVSGPALVSVVAVLSNPITIIAATAGIGWWATRSVNQKVQAAVGLRVLSLLALNGLSAGDAGVRDFLESFRALGRMREAGRLLDKVLDAYREDWARIKGARRQAVRIDERVAAVMERPIATAGGGDRLDGFLGLRAEAANAAALSALTLGDIAYNAWSLNPKVLEAVDFARVEALDDRVNFAAFAHRVESMAADAHLGAISNVKGYVAERVVASQLVSQGHVVEFPDSSNQAGWDIEVDGEKFQVKAVESLSALERHFGVGYQYPVIANAELAQELAARTEEELPAWAGDVHFVEGYSRELVENVSRHTIESGAEMLDPDIPLFAVVLSAVRQYGRAHRGEVSGSQAFQEVLLDGAARSGLAVAGGYVGTGIGLVLFGPAGALVFGALVPIASQTQAGRLRKGLGTWFKDEGDLAWHEEVLAAIERLRRRAQAALRWKQAALRQRPTLSGEDLVANYLRWRASEDLCFQREVAFRLLQQDLDRNIEDVVIAHSEWLTVCGLHPATYQTELRELAGIFAARPVPGNRVQGFVDRARQKLAEASDAAKKETAALKRKSSRRNKR